MAVNRSGPVESFVILGARGHSASIISAVRIKDDRFAAPDESAFSGRGDCTCLLDVLVAAATDDPGCGFGISILTPARPQRTMLC